MLRQRDNMSTRFHLCLECQFQFIIATVCVVIVTVALYVTELMVNESMLILTLFQWCDNSTVAAAADDGDDDYG